MRRVLWIGLGLALAGIGLFSALRAPGGRQAPGAPPLDQIDADSRHRLEQLLLEAREPEAKR